MKKVSSIVIVALVVVAVMAFAGCSSGASSSSAAASGSASSEAAASSEASASASASAASSDAASAASSAASSQAAALANGEYSATFNTDSSMFHVNESLNGKGLLTVTDEGMTIHVTLAGTGILNLYVGTAADAENDPGNQLQPTTDTVEYTDGTKEEVYGFDIPVPAIGEEFDVALIGTKGKWYDHKVSVTDVEPL